ncbi:MAG: 4Fe-4S dicluster domain-containing protein [Chloroflexi bacterium]|nr:4Fe-4S dicluster domain-containing protein [Chloroflexota bacterium]MBI2980482.1 4Fe-4S dicluster domain-containing protein [Chloroflexota bacterium]
MRKILYVDYDKCTGCELCVLHCSFQKTQTFSRSRSAVRVMREEEKGICIPEMCQHCLEPECLLVCPVNAISRDEKTGIVSHDYNLCIKGCKLCLSVCPYGALSLDPVTGKVFECNQCLGDPVCARVCPIEIIHYQKAEPAALSDKDTWKRRLLKQGMGKTASEKRFASIRHSKGDRND